MRIVILTAAAALSATVALAAGAELRRPEAFDAVQDRTERSVALFNEMAKVITHPRCMNCHPADNIPRQGDDRRLHHPPMVRGSEASFGPSGLHCTSCHGSENLPALGHDRDIPGHAPWQLAPASMAWMGLSVAEICVQLKDPERNGGRSLADIHEHHATDGLVGWGWHPGKGREPVPGTQKIFGDLTQAWIDTGAACPK
ncbi:Isoquinoline 1-oxidoreductase subunit [Methylobacterium sp. ID0610]|uniref:Isoquinoline 1-oxidoreductase subunit n=1 Tax=Methylobacterium carpenticola TaxID=3344827 RepID=UPI00368DA827